MKYIQTSFSKFIAENNRLNEVARPTTKLTCLSAFASYLVNDDASGLEESDIKALTEFMAEHADYEWDAVKKEEYPGKCEITNMSGQVMDFLGRKVKNEYWIEFFAFDGGHGEVYDKKFTDLKAAIKYATKIKSQKRFNGVECFYINGKKIAKVLAYVYATKEYLKVLKGIPGTTKAELDAAKECEKTGEPVYYLAYND
jgi:hypothetical protein